MLLLGQTIKATNILEDSEQEVSKEKTVLEHVVTSNAERERALRDEQCEFKQLFW